MASRGLPWRPADQMLPLDAGECSVSAWLIDEAVHLAVDPSDMESLLAVKASSAWAAEKNITLKIWPLLRELGNPAVDVPIGDSQMERLKARRAKARARYRALEDQRARDYVGLSSTFAFSPQGAESLAIWLRDTSLYRASMAGVWPEMYRGLETGSDSIAPPQSAEDDLNPTPTLDDVSEALAERGLYTTPAFLVGGQVLIGIGHLPLIEAIWRARA